MITFACFDSTSFHIFAALYWIWFGSKQQQECFWCPTETAGSSLWLFVVLNVAHRPSKLLGFLKYLTSVLSSIVADVSTTGAQADDSKVEQI